MAFDIAVNLTVSGMGLIFYSPFAIASIREGEDYFECSFEDPSEVEKQAVEGKIVGVSTGSPGIFRLHFRSGYPSDEMFATNQYWLRLGIEIRDETLCVRDIFDLLDWSEVCPEEQTVKLANGFYHLTLLSHVPMSGVLGDNQEVFVYLQKLDAMPKLRFNGVPTLC